MVVLDQDLSAVQPSWIQDGYGIQGEQDEYRFDDDLPWDITAWTRDHPDQDDFTPSCCAVACPTSITFNGIEFCCACTDEFSSRVEFFEDPMYGVINDVPFTDFLEDHACDPFLCYNNSSLLLPFRINDPNCPDGSEDVNSFPFTISARLVAGIWHVGVGVTDNSGLVIFYGFGADPSSITNTITDCTLSPTEFDNALTQCFGDPINSCSVAKNGTATLAF